MASSNLCKEQGWEGKAEVGPEVSKGQLNLM